MVGPVASVRNRSGQMNGKRYSLNIPGGLVEFYLILDDMVQRQRVKDIERRGLNNCQHDAGISFAP